jgi:murein DD-endopeptidase MepM/ murein hydrolase activator NlpD
MKPASGPAVFTELAPPQSLSRIYLLIALLALCIGLITAHVMGVRIIVAEPDPSGQARPSFIGRAELARIEAQYQERLDSLRAQLHQEREQLLEQHRAQAAEVASVLRVDKIRELNALRDESNRALLAQGEEMSALEREKARALKTLAQEKAASDRKHKAELVSLEQERDKLLKQKDGQLAAIKRDQEKIEQQYKRQLSEVQKRLAATVERIAQVESAQISLIKSLGVKPEPQVRPRGGQGGAYQPVDRPRPGADSFGSSVKSLNDDLDLLERGIAPIEQVWRKSLLPHTQRPVALPLRDSFYISSRFGLRTDPVTRRASRHEGVDLVTHHGAPVLATAGGQVTRSGPAGPHGQLVEIDHGNGYVTRYAHLSQRLVQAGQTVSLGQSIGRVGRSGRATGVHLHYELLHNGRPIDPTRAFNESLWAQHDRQSFSYR